MMRTPWIQEIKEITKILPILPLIGAILVTCAVSACGVDKAEHQTTVDELKTCQAEREGLVKKRDSLNQERETLLKNIETLDAEFQSKLSATKEELDELRKQRAESQKQLQEFQNLTEKFKEMIAAEGIKVYRRRGRMIVALPSGVLFASGNADLSERGARTLARVATKLKELQGRRFIVTGHTDNVPVGAEIGFQDNWELSTTRAVRVLRFLVEQGIDPKNLAAAGYGEFDPVRNNKTKQGRRLNRRIELILEPQIPDIELSELEGLTDDGPAGTGDDEEDEDSGAGAQGKTATPGKPDKAAGAATQPAKAGGATGKAGNTSKTGGAKGTAGKPGTGDGAAKKPGSK